LSWGHTPYLNNASPPQLINEPEMIDFFNYGGVGNENNKKISKLDLLKQITKKRKSSVGNYDAFLGTVYNFSYDGDKDGAYICKIQLMGAGGMLESLKINNSFNIDFTNPTIGDKAEKYISTLDNALAAMHQYLIQAGDALYTKNISNKEVELNFGKIGPDSFYRQNFTKSKQYAKSNVTYEIGKDVGTWGGLLDTIYNSTSYTPINFIKEGNKGILSFKNETDPFKYGNAHQIITGKAETDSSDGVDNLPPITEELFSGYVGQWVDEEELSFITFGHLMALVNLLGIFVESDDITGKNSTPIVYIDFHPDNTEMDLGPIVASLDPYTCLVPFISNIDYENYFKPLNINTPDKPWWNIFAAGGNAPKNIKLEKNNRINKIYKPSDFSVDLTYGGGGKLFNVLINTNFARKCLKNTTDPDGNTSVLDFLTKILNGVNQSLGGVNNFRPFVDECGLVLRIVDEKILKLTHTQTQKV
jgi:hypothetical protein